jgi:hypothetical protein
MNNKFDNLAKVALNEASLGDYMKAVKSAAGKATKKIAKSAVKGLAQLPGAAIKGAGIAYSAMGGTQGGALLQKAGGAVQKAGLSALTSSVQAWRNLKTAAEKQEYIRQNLGPVKSYIDKKFPTLTRQQRNKLQGVTDFDQLDTFAKNNIKGKTLDQIMYDYNQSILPKQTKPSQQKQPTPQTVPVQAPVQIKQPKLKANRSMVKDTTSGIVYRFLGRDQGGWYIYDPLTKKTDPAPIDPRDQKTITALWRKKEIANTTSKQPNK